MAPARLRESDRGIVECTDRSPQKILRRDKVGVEDGDKRRLCLFHAVCESARFEPGARPSAQLSYADTLAAPRSEERRVGKECSCRCARCLEKMKHLKVNDDA